ncbi:hypothetical protein KPH14_000834, partial [Odynerus spinipes]
MNLKPTDKAVYSNQVGKKKSKSKVDEMKQKFPCNYC